MLLPGAAPQQGVGCVPNLQRPCVDPNDPDVDTNGDGTISDQEATAVCSGKIPNVLDFPFHGPGFVPHPELPGSPPPVGPYDGAVVFGPGSVADADELGCNPASPSHTAPWPNSTVPPTHTGSFAAASGSQSGPKAQVALNGVDVAVDVAEEVAFAITDCTQLRTHEVCYLQLHELNLNVEGDLEFGDYTVDMASFNLSVPFQTTTVTFSCDAQGCLGSFDFSSRVGTTLGMNMSWEQTKIATGSVGKGFLALGADGLASLARVQGELDLDASKSAGTLRLHGSGSDKFGGEFASVRFDIAGPVGRAK